MEEDHLPGRHPVMMGLALPFAYMHMRSGGVSLKVFAGIMLGPPPSICSTASFAHRRHQYRRPCFQRSRRHCWFAAPRR